MLLSLLLQATALSPSAPPLDVKPTVQVGGRVAIDTLFASGDNDLTGGGEVRFARLRLSGQVVDGVDYMMEYDFTGTFSGAKDVYLRFHDAAPGAITVGHLFEPFGLGIATGVSDTTFLERSLVSNAITPRRAIGVQYSDHATHWTALGGLFQPTLDNAQRNPLSPEDRAATGRLVWRPWLSADAAELLAFGGGLSYRRIDELAAFAARPGVHLARPLVGATVPADGMLSGTVDVAFQQGPLWASAEYVHNTVSDLAGLDPTVTGWSLMAGWFMAGGHRGYNTAKGGWARVQPVQDGGEAWELAAGYESLDLSEIAGGTLDLASLGLNWYLNDHLRFTFDVLRSDNDGLTDTLVAARVSWDF